MDWAIIPNKKGAEGLPFTLWGLNLVCLYSFGDSGERNIRAGVVLHLHFQGHTPLIAK